MAKTKKIKTTLIDGSFSDKPHIFYFTYDELADEFIIRLIKPETVAAVMDLEGNDKFSLLIEPQTNEVVGFNLYNFTSEHLPNWELLREKWYKLDLPKVFENYHTAKYNPKEHKKHHHTNATLPNDFPQQFAKSVPILEEALV
jgi:hypothetical protein